MNKRASFLLISSAPIPGQPVATRLRKIGSGSSPSSNATQHYKDLLCLRCSVSSIPVAIDRLKSEPCNGILQDGALCMDLSRRSSLSNDTSLASEHNRISPIWRIWASPLQGSP